MFKGTRSLAKGESPECNAPADISCSPIDIDILRNAVFNVSRDAVTFLSSENKSSSKLNLARPPPGKVFKQHNIQWKKGDLCYAIVWVFGVFF